MPANKTSVPYVLPNGVVIDLMRVDDVRYFASRRPPGGYAFHPCVDVKLEPETPYPYNTVRCMFRTEQEAIDAAKSISEAVERAQAAAEDEASEPLPESEIPKELWMLWATERNETRGYWLRALDRVEGGALYLVAMSRADAQRAAEDHLARYTFSATCVPVRVKHGSESSSA